MKIAKLNSRKKSRVISNGAPLKLDIGCGSNKKQGFTGVDCINFPGVDVVVDLARRKQVITESGAPPSLALGRFIPWPWEDSSVEEIHCSHCIEHFDAVERVHFVNEMWRVLKPGAKATVIAPHWASCRAYGDPTHKWPPVSEFWFYYLKKDWRLSQAPHTDSSNWKEGFKCNFEVTWGYSLEQGLHVRNQEYQQTAITYFKEACQDTIATFVAVK